MDYLQRVEDMTEDLNAEHSAEGAARLWAAMVEAKRQLREMEKTAHEALIEYVKENGDIILSEDEFVTVGVQKLDKQSKDKMAIIDAIYTAAQGDTAAVAECLASDPFKQGATQKLIGTDKVDGQGKPLFWKEETDKIEVKKINKKFIGA